MTKHHRRLPAPVSGLFAVGIAISGSIAGAAIVGRPSARYRDRGYTAEVTRVRVLTDVPNGCPLDEQINHGSGQPGQK